MQEAAFRIMSLWGPRSSRLGVRGEDVRVDGLRGACVGVEGVRVEGICCETSKMSLGIAGVLLL